jgi:hypothetical protein
MKNFQFSEKIAKKSEEKSGKVGESGEKWKKSGEIINIALELLA